MRRRLSSRALPTRQFGRVHVDAITLFESRLSPKGRRHTSPLQRTARRAEPAQTNLKRERSAGRRRRLPHRIDPVRLPAVAAARRRSAPGRQRQRRRGERAADERRPSRGPGDGARRREGRGGRARGAAADRRCRRRRWPPVWRRSSVTSIRCGCASAAARAWRRRPACSRVLTPAALGVAAGVFVLVVWVTRYISVGSMAAALTLAGVTIATRCAGGGGRRGGARGRHGHRHRHRANLARLIAGTERRVGQRLCQSELTHASTLAVGGRTFVRSRFSARGAGARRSPCIWRASVTTRVCGRAMPALVADMRARRANAVYLPDIRFPAAAAGDGRSRRGARRRRARRRGRAVARHARRSCSAPRRIIRPGRDRRQRDEGARAGHAVPGVRDHRAGAAARRARRRALGPELRGGAGARSCRPRSRSRRATPRSSSRCRRSSARRTSGSTAPSDVVGVEIGGALKNVIAIAAGVVEGLGARAQRAGRPHHARAGRDHAAGVRRRRAARDAGRADRSRRSRADVHGRAEPQPARRRRAGARPLAAATSSPA